jgi:hypothetical protein
VGKQKRALIAVEPKKTAGWWLTVLAPVFLVPCGLVPFTHAQTPPATEATPTAQAPSINTHVNVDEISLDLVVHDKRYKCAPPCDTSALEEYVDCVPASIYCTESTIIEGHSESVLIPLGHFSCYACA